VQLPGPWRVKFIEGGPELPASFQSQHAGSWTQLGDTNAQCFAGTAIYSTTFDAPPQNPDHWLLNLGKVCQSARVRVNGRDCGTLLIPPFQVKLGQLKPTGNTLEVEVTNVSANRIRDLDRRGIKWKNFYDTNFVNLSYHPFDASDWPITDSGLVGPVTISSINQLFPN
jgi:hypothetical protein